VESGRLAPDVGRVVLDGMKWVACKFYPRLYGDKVERTVVEASGGPVNGVPKWR